MADYSPPAMTESPAYSVSSSSSTTSKSAPVTTTIYLSTYTTASSYSTPSSLSVSSSTAMSGIPTLPSSYPTGLAPSTLFTSVTTPPSGSVAPPPVPTTKPTYWGWACNSTNGTLPEQLLSQSGLGCSETFVIPSSTKLSINLTEPTPTGNDNNNNQPTRTFTPGDFPGAAPRGIDIAFGGIAGWTGLMAVVGVWIGLI